MSSPCKKSRKQPKAILAGGSDETNSSPKKKSRKQKTGEVESTQEEESEEMLVYQDQDSDKESKEEDDDDIKILKYLCKYNWYYGSVSHIFENLVNENRANRLENNPLMVFFKCDVEGNLTRNMLQRLNNDYKRLVSEKGFDAKREDFSSPREYRFFYLSKLAWEDDSESDVERAKMKWVPYADLVRGC